MDFIKKLLLTFVLILAGITVSTAIFITIFFPTVEFTIWLLWQIILMSAVCAMGNLIFHSKREIGKRQMKFRMVVHYLYVNAVVLGGSILWGWFTPGLLKELLTMLFLIAAVYAGVMTVNLKSAERTAEDLNQRLRKFHSGTEEKDE